MFFKQAVCKNTKIIEINKNTIPQLYKTAAKHWTEISAFPDRYRNLFSNYITANKIRVGEYNPEFKYYRVVAMHGDVPNENADFWHWGSIDDPDAPELLRYDKSLGKQIYSTFNGRGNFKNHNNDDVSNAVGIVLDTIPNHQEKSIEALIAVDEVKDPMLVRGIDNGYINSVSMGCLCGHSLCSICGNKAYNESQYCDHIRSMKGQTIYHKGEHKQVYEDNRQVCFIELSWVDIPADSKANLLEKVAQQIVLSEDSGLIYDTIVNAINDAEFLCGNDYEKLLKAVNYQIAKKVAEVVN